MNESVTDETVNWKARWLEALRSGRYAQGTGTLRKDESFCCLGVLCDVIDQQNWEGPMPSGTYALKVHEGDHLLPAHLELVTGISTDKQWDLANMNDRSGKSFADIADWIEVNL